MTIDKIRKKPAIDIVIVDCIIEELPEALDQVDRTFQFIDQVRIYLSDVKDSFFINRNSFSGRVYLYRDKGSKFNIDQSYMSDPPQKFGQELPRIMHHIKNH